MKGWTLAQASAFRTNFLTISGLRTMGTTLITNVTTGFIAATSASWAFVASLLANPLTWVAAAVVAAVFLIWKYWKPISGFFKGLWAGIKEGAAPIAQALAPAFKSLAAFLSPVIGLLKGVWNWVVNLVKPVDDTGHAAENLGLRWGRAIGGMVVAVAGLPGKLFNAGRTMVEMLWKGIQVMASKPVEAMKSIAQKVRNLLPFSPAKEGPLRDLHRIRLVETIAQGVRPAPLVTAMTQTVKLARMAVGPQMGQVPARAAQAGGAAAGGGQIVIHYAPTIHMPGASKQDKDDVMAILRQHKEEVRRLVDSAKTTRQRSAYA
jgi:hypothetical protein